MSDLNDLISTDESAKILECCPGTIRNMVRDGRLPLPIRVNATTHRHRRKAVAALAAKLRAEKQGHQQGVTHE